MQDCDPPYEESELLITGQMGGKCWEYYGNNILHNIETEYILITGLVICTKSLRNSATTQSQLQVELSKRNFIKKPKHSTPKPQNSHIPKILRVQNKHKKYWEGQNNTNIGRLETKAVQKHQMLSEHKYASSTMAD